MSKKNGSVPTPTEMVSLTITVPRFYEVNLVSRDDAVKVTRDLKDLDARVFERLFDYGIGRYNRDGTTKVREKGADGKMVERDATNEERPALAAAKWAALVEGRARTHAASGDALLSTLRAIAVNVLKKRGMSGKQIPKMPDRAAVKTLLGEDVFEKALARAEVATAAMRDIE